MIELSTPEERLAAAGEYVLGTLSREDHGALSGALAGDAALRAEVYAWQDRLLGLTARVTPAVPAAAVWRRIDAALVEPSALASARAPVPQPAKAPPWWQRLVAWQGISAAAVAAALMLAVVLFQRMAAPELAPAQFLAVLQSPDDRSTGWVVEIAADRTLRLLPVAAAAPVPPGRSLQFWTKPQGAAGPTSLGLVRAGQKLELPASAWPDGGEQQLFELTLEPENGSPLPRPTGPILYVGRSVRL